MTKKTNFEEILPILFSFRKTSVNHNVYFFKTVLWPFYRSLLSTQRIYYLIESKNSVVRKCYKSFCYWDNVTPKPALLRMPKDQATKDRLSEQLNLNKNEIELKSFRFCSMHFSEDSFIKDKNGAIKRLIENPTIKGI